MNDHLNSTRFLARGLWYVFVVLLCASCTTAGPEQVNEEAPQTDAVASTPRAVLDREQAQVGRVAQGTTVTEAFELANLGDVPLVVRSVNVSIPGMRVRVKQTTEPGERAPLYVDWDTTNVVGDMEGIAVLTTNDPVRDTIRLIVQGTIFAPVDVLPRPMAFLSAFQGDVVARELIIENNTDTPLGIGTLDVRGDTFTADVEAVEDGQRYRLLIRSKGDVAPGRYREQLVVHTDSAARPRIGIGVNVLVKTDVHVTPDALTFGTVKRRDLDNPNAAPFLVQRATISRRQGTMRIVDVVTDVPDLTVEVDPEGDAADTFGVRAWLSPSAAAGEFAGVVVLKTDDDEHPEIRIPVRARITE